MLFHSIFRKLGIGDHINVAMMATTVLNKCAKILTVKVTKDNLYMIDDKQINENNLIKVLKEQSETNKDGVLIQASGESNHEAVVKLMDSARNAGVSSISIIEM